MSPHALINILRREDNLSNYIFNDSPISDFSATFGWQSTDQALWGVKEGFKNSADDLVKKVLRECKKNNVRVLDTYIFPIMYLYRQSLEVSLKIIYHRCFGKIADGGHNLSTLWENTYKEVIVEKIQNPSFIQKIKRYKKNFHQFSMEGINFNKITGVFSELQRFDNNSDVFRYMVDKKAKTYFNNTKYIDYKDLRTLMNEIFNVLDFLYEVIDDYLSGEI